MTELFVDNFAGGGGASTGIEIAIGRSVDIAVNHDPDAIAMHRGMASAEILRLRRTDYTAPVLPDCAVRKRGDAAGGDCTGTGESAGILRK